MPWKEVSTMSTRREFVTLAAAAGSNIRELCRRFEVSPTTAYKWIGRGSDAAETFADRSRRPRRSPNRTEARLEETIVAIRDKHPYWNARKIRRVLQRQVKGPVPAASTVGQILKRHGRITAPASQAATHWHRFEHPEPNDLSQIDFMGHFAIGKWRCYPLTMLDDHSRYSQLLAACVDEQTDTVQRHLIETFRKFGLPWWMNMDNGNPWGNPTGDPYTKFTVWLIRLGVHISHSRPMHPQTNGKDERFHKTLRVELVNHHTFSTLSEVQSSFDRWRDIYNHERPHESLALEVPASRYRPSPRSYPERLPPIEYASADLVRTIRSNGMLYAWKQDFYIGQAFAHQPVALRPTLVDGVWDVYYCSNQIATVDRRDPANGELS